jgi:hypothetical protein
VAVLLRIQSHGGIPVSNLATYLGKLDRAYVRFAAVEALSAYAVELGRGPEVLESVELEAGDIAYSVRRARRFVAVEDRLKLLSVQLASPGEFKVAAAPDFERERREPPVEPHAVRCRRHRSPPPEPPGRLTGGDAGALVFRRRGALVNCSWSRRRSSRKSAPRVSSWPERP